MSWPLVKLGDVAPAKPSKNFFSTNEEVWTLNLDQIEADTGKVLGKIMVPVSEAGTSTHGFDERHVLYSKLRPYLNKVVLPNGRGLATTELVPLLPDPLRLDRKYLAYYLRSKSFVDWVSSQVAGAKMPRVSMQLFWQHEIPLPPLPEQKRIASILDKADAIRRKRQQTIQLADDFLRAVFLDMFGDPVTNPKGWEERSLASLVVGKFQNGAYYPKEEYSDDGVEMVHMSDAFYDVIQRGNLKRVLANKTDVEKYSLTHEDLMISRRSLNYEGAAKPSMIPNSKEPLIFESSIIRITPDKKKIDLLYLFHYLSNPTVKDHHVRKFVTGATIKGISQKNLEQVTVLVPPLSVQRKFSSIVERQNCTKKMVSESFEKSIETFNSLSQKAFRGEL
ncbi:restriction endonuclease subunit S [Pseudomonas aeruginosa]